MHSVNENKCCYRDLYETKSTRTLTLAYPMCFPSIRGPMPPVQGPPWPRFRR